jgi:iron complex outermembrane receptor protein
MITRFFVCLSPWILLILPVGAEIMEAEFEGEVRSTSGLPIEHAKVSSVHADFVAFTDSAGRFQVEACPLPCLLVVQHPRFGEEAVEVREVGALTAIVLTPKQAIFEQIEVTASRGGGSNFAPLSVASSVVHPGEVAHAPSSLTELVEGIAGVAENGQGGLFQVFSIRGVSRHRVLTLVSGMPMTSERRAGVSTSFIDPLLMGSVEVLRGPASTYYGSGALGGVVQVFPRSFQGFQIEAGFSSFGDENFQLLGWGDGEPSDGWSLGIAQRSTDDDEAADGTPLNNHFTQYSAVLRRAWQHAERKWELLLIPTLGQDIGKPNSDFPARITNYPRERHLLVKLGLVAPAGWSFHVFAHPNDLETEVLRARDSRTTVLNNSFDFGADWQRQWSLGGKSGAGKSGASGSTGRMGVSYSGRRGVKATETVLDLADGTTTSTDTLQGGKQDEAAVYGSLRWGWGPGTWQVGSRWTLFRQNQDRHRQDFDGQGLDRQGFDRQEGPSSENASMSRHDSALTGFLGLVYPLGKGLEFTANLGTGLRFPNLSERFFTGTTGRGQVIGNPDLEAESSLNTDVGLRWFGKKAFLSAQLFRLGIDDYIERIDLANDTRTFANLSDGTLTGVELEGFYQLNQTWRLNFTGHILSGENDAGLPLADIPADQLGLSLTYRRSAWEGRVRLQLRGSKNDPGSGELAIPSAQLVAASLRYEFGRGLALTLRGRNLLDQDYFRSADDKSSPAPGRSLGLSLSWDI